MSTTRVRHEFGKPGLIVSWDEGDWTHEVRLVTVNPEDPSDDRKAVCVETRHSLRRGHVLPQGGQKQSERAIPTEAMQNQALELLRTHYEHANDSTRYAYRLAGFTDLGDLDQPIRPRGQPRTPPVVFAAIAVLWEKEKSRKHLASQLGFSYAWVKPRVRHAARLGYLEGDRATEEARRLVLEASGGSDAITAADKIVAAWSARTL